MKLIRSVTALLLVAVLGMTGCKSKSPKEMIVNKWKVTAVAELVAIADQSPMSDQAKKEMIDNMALEFTKDGKCTIFGTHGSTEKGDYSLSDDGKTLTITRNGKDKADMLAVDELTGSKLTVTDTKNNLKVTFAKQ